MLPGVWMPRLMRATPLFPPPSLCVLSKKGGRDRKEVGGEDAERRAKSQCRHGATALVTHAWSKAVCAANTCDRFVQLLLFGRQRFQGAMVPLHGRAQCLCKSGRLHCSTILYPSCRIHRTKIIYVRYFWLPRMHRIIWGEHILLTIDAHLR